MVADLLNASHTAHAAYRDAVRLNDHAGARAALQAALDARVQAMNEDQSFSDPAWQEESGAYPHVALLGFYRDQLGRP